MSGNQCCGRVTNHGGNSGLCRWTSSGRHAAPPANSAASVVTIRTHNNNRPYQSSPLVRYQILFLISYIWNFISTRLNTCCPENCWQYITYVVLFPINVAQFSIAWNVFIICFYFDYYFVIPYVYVNTRDSFIEIFIW